MTEADFLLWADPEDAYVCHCGHNRRHHGPGCQYVAWVTRSAPCPTCGQSVREPNLQRKACDCAGYVHVSMPRP